MIQILFRSAVNIIYALLKTPNVQIKSELPKEVNEEKFVRGRSVVNPKSKNVKVKMFTIKNLKDKHQEVKNRGS